MQLYMDSNKSQKLHDNKSKFLWGSQKNYTSIPFHLGSVTMTHCGNESQGKTLGKSL